MDRDQIERTAREAGRDAGPEIIVEWCNARELAAELVGVWVWVTFPSKPAPEMIADLKAAGFRWSPKRQQWYHPCGHPLPKKNRRKPTKQHPRERYGSVPVRELEAAQ